MSGTAFQAVAPPRNRTFGGALSVCPCSCHVPRTPSGCGLVMKNEGERTRSRTPSVQHRALLSLVRDGALLPRAPPKADVPFLPRGASDERAWAVGGQTVRQSEVGGWVVRTRGEDRGAVKHA